MLSSGVQASSNMQAIMDLIDRTEVSIADFSRSQQKRSLLVPRSVPVVAKCMVLAGSKGWTWKMPFGKKRTLCPCGALDL